MSEAHYQARRWMLRWGTRAEAWLALVLARLCVAVLLEWFAPWAFCEAVETGGAPHPHLVDRIVRSLDSAGRALPGETLCLPRALAGKAMLARRGWPSTIRLGVHLREAHALGQPGTLHAHAWLVVRGAVVLGADGMEKYVPVPAQSALVER